LLKISIEDQTRIISWAEDKIGCKFRPDAKAIAHYRDNKLAGVVVYDCFGECDCNIHVASDGNRRWVTKSYLAEVFAYPFLQCGFRRITGLVPYKNKPAIRFNTHLGFTVEGVCREALPDDDIVVMGMLKRDCRFIPRRCRNG
jgi:RimJ/RimL family protein N-acetyltransferase